MEKIIRAATGKNIKKIRKLLDEGADVNATTNLGWTPLHPAAETSQPHRKARIVIRYIGVGSGKWGIHGVLL